MKGGRASGENLAAALEVTLRWGADRSPVLRYPGEGREPGCQRIQRLAS